MCKMLVFTGVVLGMLVLGAAQTTANPVPWAPVRLYADAAGSTYWIHDPEGTVSIYVFLNAGFSTGATELFFAAPKPSCFNAVYVGETHDFTTSGDSQTGMYVFLGGECLSGPRRLAVITYEILGATPECCYYWVQPYVTPGSDVIGYFDCSGSLSYGGRAYLLINPSESVCFEVVPAETSTWGKVKSLYAQ